MSWLTSVFSFISAPATQWLKNRGEIKKAKHTRDLAVINNQARLAADEQTFNHEWEMASLKDKNEFLRVFSFILFTAPILVVVFNPQAGRDLLANLEMIPEHILTIWYYMIGGIWGLSELKNNVPSIIGAIRGSGKGK